MDIEKRKMWKTQLLFLICLKMTMVLSAPFQFPLLHPLQGTLEQQRLALQEQMFALQQFQALQAIKAIPTVAAINNPPILLVYPNFDKETNIKTKEKQKTGYEDNDSNSIVIDSDNEYNDNNNNLNAIKEERVKAVILVPNARGVVGDFITGIPFLPIEINVPDSIAWIYKWFSDLIAGWGQGRQTEMMWRVMQMNQNRPLMMVPFNQPYF